MAGSSILVYATKGLLGVKIESLAEIAEFGDSHMKNMCIKDLRLIRFI